MEALLNRYRNLTVLLIVVVAQLIYLGYQVKTARDERLIRVWAVTAVTPMAGIVEAIRRDTIGFLQDYFILLDVREENRKLKVDNDKLRMENVYFRNQLATAEHARALTLFQAQSPSKTVAARVIGNSTVSTAKAVFIDRGSTSGIEKGMAVVTPEGIVGKVAATYPLVAQVLLVTDSTFKVGVESQKGHVHGVLNCGTGKCVVEQIQNEDKIDVGEWFYTSGEDRLFPKGFPVGTVVATQPGQGMKEVKLNLSGAPGGTEEVLVVLQGVHQALPTKPPVIDDISAKMLAPPPDDTKAVAPVAKVQTEADKLVQRYQAIGKEQGHVFGAHGSNIPNFNTSGQSAAKTSVATPGASTAAAKPLVTGAPTSSGPAGVNQSVKPAPSGPTVLGLPRVAKPPATNTAAPQTKPAEKPAPVLPLGAPRTKSTGPTEKQTPPSGL